MLIDIDMEVSFDFRLARESPTLLQLLFTESINIGLERQVCPLHDFNFTLFAGCFPSAGRRNGNPMRGQCIEQGLTGIRMDRQ